MALAITSRLVSGVVIVDLSDGLRENAQESRQRSRGFISSNSIWGIRTKPQPDPGHAGRNVPEMLSTETKLRVGVNVVCQIGSRFA
ncbi:MAG: hypothetical protein DMG18_16310 [Acidobacteria bacterium]|nr:MAG: hypothetical protein DMG18_16310 [Acidobacteriota bacterium]